VAACEVQPDREIGGNWRQWCIPKWRAAADEDGHYCFALAL